MLTVGGIGVPPSLLSALLPQVLHLHIRGVPGAAAAGSRRSASRALWGIWHLPGQVAATGGAHLLPTIAGLVAAWRQDSPNRPSRSPTRPSSTSLRRCARSVISAARRSCSRAPDAASSAA